MSKEIIIKKKNNKNKYKSNVKVSVTKKKIIFKLYDRYIKNLLKEGMHFFFFTINIIDLVKSFNKEFKNPEYYRSPMKTLGIALEDTINNFESIELIDFSLITVERHRSGAPHIHGIVGFRSINHSTDTLLTELENIFWDRAVGLEDNKINHLKNFIDIKRAFRYMSKELSVLDIEIPFKLYLHLYSTMNLEIHKDFYEDIIQISYEEYSDYEDLIEKKYENIEDVVKRENLSYREIRSKWVKLEDVFMTNLNKLPELWDYNNKNMIDGFKVDHKTSNKIYILRYINIYMYMNDMFFYNNNLYIKNPNTKYSYVYLGGLDYLFKNILKVKDYITTNFSNTFTRAELDSLFVDNENYVKSFLKNKDVEGLRKKEIKFDILEFNDGIYILNYNAFFNTEQLLKQNTENIISVRYYNMLYASIRVKKTPKTWLKYISQNVDNVDEFCSKFSRYFREYEKSKSKKNAMFIKGVSNSGKTQLLTNTLFNTWGMENISMLTDNSNFTFENITRMKKLICNDEFEYKKKHRSGLLKLIEGALMAVNRKGETASIEKNITANVLLLGNETLSNREMLKDAAFKNRLDVYTFSQELDISEEDILKIKQEEPKIIIHCNKLFFKDVKKIRALRKIFLNKLIE